MNTNNLYATELQQIIRIMCNSHNTGKDITNLGVLSICCLITQKY